MRIDLTNAQRQAAYRERRAAEGVVQVQVFVHRTRANEVRALAGKMQKPKPRRRRAAQSDRK